MSAYEICKCGRHENASAHTHTGHSDYHAFEPKPEEPKPLCPKCGSVNLNDCGMGGKTCLDCQWVQGVGEPCEEVQLCPTCGKIYDVRDYYNPDGSSRCVPRCWSCSLKVKLKTPEHIALEAAYEMWVKENEELKAELERVRADFEKLEANWDELRRDLDRGKFETTLEVGEAMDLMSNRK